MRRISCGSQFATRLWWIFSRISPQISSDRLHFNMQGYARLAPSLDREIDQLVGGR